MGQLISTGVHRDGHSTNFKTFVSKSGNKKCDMVCECGWVKEITSYGNPWCHIEVQVEYNDHLIDCGLIPLTNQHSQN
jgi:hypothetical protein